MNKVETASLPLVNGIQISEEKERFLLLNGILHGMKVGEGIYATEDVAAISGRIGELSGLSNADAIVAGLNQLVGRDIKKEFKEKVDCNEATMITNFFRVNDYAFICDSDYVNINGIVEAYKSKRYPVEAINRLVCQIFETIDNTKSGVERIEDGAIVSSNVNTNMWRAAIEKGFADYVRGPAWLKQRHVDLLRKHTVLDGFQPMGQKVFGTLLSGLALAKVNPKLCLYTFLSVPNYVNTFRRLYTVVDELYNKPDLFVVLADDGHCKHSFTLQLSDNDVRQLLGKSKLALACLSAEGSMRYWFDQRKYDKWSGVGVGASVGIG